MDPATSAIDVIELSDSELPPQRVTRMQTRRATAALQRQQPLSQPSDVRSTAPRVQHVQPRSVNDTSHLQPQGDAIVTCPLCDKSTRARDMDRHMDSGCTMLIYKPPAAGSSATGVSSFPKFAGSRRPPEERKHKPSIHYHGYKDREIQRLLSVDMLSASGDRNVLIRRHAEWTKRYNANIDEGGTKSHAQLAKELGEWERALAAPKVSAFTATPRHEETQQTVLEREEHSRKYADEFEKMVDGLKKRKRAKLETAASADAEGPV
ncbi:E3 ubiquitin-protein ligase rad18 [Geranomyces variabilis]|uniref:E3 ubiquitin-protein ligase rad18 n=1 Tax=Geranomyces variabilis TaxID=109894 RepID=A0AAD5TIV3_9FUNG|nr:E3 ubiquitin-protein ligase rad18 [Geranomyces variabilis]